MEIGGRGFYYTPAYSMYAEFGSGRSINIYKWGSRTTMAERPQRQRLRALQNNRQLARFIVQGKATGKQLGTGSYGSVEEVAIG